MRCSLFCICLCLALLQAPPALCGETQGEAGIGFGAEFNDNVRETAKNPKSDLITHIKPSLLLRHAGGRVQGQVSYKGDYQFHVKGTDYDDYAHYLNASVLGEIVENLFFIDVQEDLQPVYRSARRGEVYEGDSTRNQVNRNRFTVSPYFSLNPTERFNMRVGYRFTDLRYSKNDDGRGRDNFFPRSGSDYDFNTNASQQHTVFTNLMHELTDKLALMANADVTRNQGESDVSGEDNSFYRYQVQIGGSYAVTEDLSVKALAGPAYTAYDDGKNSLAPYALLELTQRVGRSEFGLKALMDFTDDPYTGDSLRHTEYGVTWRKTFDRSLLAVGISYHIYDGGADSSSRSNAWRPYIRYTYGLSDRLTFNAGGSMDMAEDRDTGSSWTYADAGLKYQLDENAWISLSYRYKYADVSRSDAQYYGDHYGGGSYSVNRVMLEFYMQF